MVAGVDFGCCVFRAIRWCDAGAGRRLADGPIRLGQDGVGGFTMGGIGLILFSFIQGALQYYFAFFLLSLGFSVGGFVPSITAVNAWMVRNRATAMSFVIGGSSVAGLLVPPMVWSIATYGWRPTVFVIGVIAIVLGPVVARLLGKRPTPEQIEEQTRQSSEPGRRSRRTRLYDFTPKEALRTPAFWSISMTHMLVNLSTGAISGHLFLHLTDANGVNLDDATASGVVPILVVTTFVFQLGGGIMGDRISKRVLVPFLLLIQGAALVILAIADTFYLGRCIRHCVGRRIRSAHSPATCDAGRVFRTAALRDDLSGCRAFRCR